MNSLQKVLTANAVFSGLSGLTLVFTYGVFARLFSVSNSTIFLIIGILLMLFSTLILFQIKKQNRKGILFIILQDVLWVIGSLLILFFKPFGISAIGHIIIGTVALIVLLLAFGQTKFLGNIERV